MVNYKLPQWYINSHESIKQNFTTDNFQGIEKISSKGNFTFVIERYQKQSLAGHQTYFLGTLYEGKKEIAKIHSNASNFWHCWIERKDNTYLMCNEDTQGYTIIDTKNKKTLTYIDPKAKNGWGFSWKEVYPAPDGYSLAVQGDYMETAHEIAVYDLSEICLPLPKIKSLNTNKKLKGWDGKQMLFSYPNNKLKY